jgi:hypothetical protein
VRGDAEPEGPSLARLIGHFVGHVCLGTVGFVALAIPAILLSLAAHYFEQTPVSIFVINILLTVHYSLLVIDTGMFAAYILVSIYSADPLRQGPVMRHLGKAFDLRSFAEGLGEAFDARRFAKAFGSAFNLREAGKAFLSGFREGAGFVARQFRRATDLAHVGPRHRAGASDAAADH